MNNLAGLSDLARIPYTILECERDQSTGEKRKKLTQAMNLRLMRGLSNNPNGMFGMRDH